MMTALFILITSSCSKINKLLNFLINPKYKVLHWLLIAKILAKINNMQEIKLLKCFIDDLSGT